MALTKVANTLLDFTGGFVAGNVSFPAITTVGDTNTGIYFPAADTIAFTEGGVESARIDSVGNFGLGFTPSVQYSGIKSLQIGSTTNLFDQGVSTKLYHNAYTATSGNDTHLIDGYAQAYLMPSNGHHIWYISTSGIAGNSISFSQAMTLDASGNLLLGATTSLNTNGFQLSSGSGASASPYAAIFNTATSPTSSASTRFDMGFLSGVGNYVATGTVLGQMYFMGQANDAGYAGAFINATIISGGNVARASGHSVALAFGTKSSSSSGAVEAMRILPTGETLVGTTTGSLYGFFGVAKAVTIGSISASAGFSDAVNSTFRITHGGGFAGINFDSTNLIFQSGGSSPTTRMTIASSGAVSIGGSLSKGSGSFRIEHPLLEKSETHELVHSFIEGPQADLIYRGKVNLVAGTATVNIDTASGMTQGTFEVLCRDVQCFTTNESDWTAVRGSVTGNILTIEAQDNTSTASISWMVIGERKDKHIYDTEWTDDDGKVIVEPLKVQPVETE